ncbi:MAG: hypothetical protein CMM26_11125 [Rhodospirillaceae bacterium]|nr:hypothetical protein [Rhodospirillaceae bacterium]|tara:strand:+ start:427 stop:840 length:414 start_codon:yes stop_codon:yes gene_type:complete
MAVNESNLVGAWTLDEMYAEDEDGTRFHPMGRDAGGMIMYTADGYMSAITHCADRFLPTDRPSDEERAEAFSSYFNYAGTWQLENDTVTHTIQTALDPNMVGMTLSRDITKNGNKMVFSGLGPDGITRQFIIWKRPA